MSTQPKKISELTDGSAPQSGDEYPAHRGSGNVRLPVPIFVDAETPAGTINGTNGTDGNATFALAHAPAPASSHQLVKTDIGTGVVMIAGVHYNLSGLTITYTAGNIPIVGQTHRSSYRYY